VGGGRGVEVLCAGALGSASRVARASIPVSSLGVIERLAVVAHRPGKPVRVETNVSFFPSRPCGRYPPVICGRAKWGVHHTVVTVCVVYRRGGWVRSYALVRITPSRIGSEFERCGGNPSRDDLAPTSSKNTNTPSLRCRVYPPLIARRFLHLLRTLASIRGGNWLSAHGEGISSLVAGLNGCRPSRPRRRVCAAVSNSSPRTRRVLVSFAGGGSVSVNMMTAPAAADERLNRDCRVQWFAHAVPPDSNSSTKPGALSIRRARAAR